MIRLTTLLPVQWRESPRTVGLIEALQSEMDRLDAALAGIAAAVRAPYGEWLDLLGRIVGVQRGGRDDTGYAAIIQVWTVVRKSRGDWGSILSALAVMVSSGVLSAYRAWAMEPARIRFDVTGVSSVSTVAALLRAMVAAGVDTSVIYAATPSRFKLNQSVLQWMGASTGDRLGSTVDVSSALFALDTSLMTWTGAPSGDVLGARA